MVNTDSDEYGEEGDSGMPSDSLDEDDHEMDSGNYNHEMMDQMDSYSENYGFPQ